MLKVGAGGLLILEEEKVETVLSSSLPWNGL